MMDDVSVDIAKAKSICDNVTLEIAKANVDPALVPIFTGLNEALILICDNQRKIVDSRKNQVSTVITTQDQVHKRFKSTDNLLPPQPSVRPRSNMVNLATLPHRQPPRPQDKPEVKKFKDAVRDAEKSTLIFNLDMGKVPLVNRDTMSTRATMALTQRAAQVENSRTSVPSADSMAAIDDALSVVTGMKFYGRATKSYQKANDPLSGSFCTVPVRYDFQDKETRSYAENVLRDKCKVQCSTPYPIILRETIRQVINGVKAEYPNSYVRVSVDTSDMCLRVARRPMIDPGSNAEKSWHTLDDPVPIPAEALDIAARKVPDGFKITHSFRKVRSGSKTNNPGMEVDLPDSPVPGQETGAIPKTTTPGRNVARQLQM
jgi:hypothetical protein